MRLSFRSFAALLVTVGACRDSVEGGSCDTEGSTDGCESKLVCGHHGTGQGLSCLEECTDDGDCLSTETCSGIKGSLKGCILR